MMNDIIFRGKRVDNNEWVYGNYLHLNIGEDYICDGVVWFGTKQPCKEKVISETIGQYTGITDKNGTKIFENDIITTSTGRKCLVVWFHSIQYCGWDLQPIEWKNPAPAKWDLYESSNLEVVGNIYDNNELLEETK